MRNKPFVLAVALLILVLAQPLSARDKGWVPLKDNNAANLHVPIKKSRSDKPDKVVKKSSFKQFPLTGQMPKTRTVYANQPPVTEKEISAFMELLPRFRVWASKNGEEAHPIVGNNGEPDFLYSPTAAQWVSSNNFDPARFFCIMGRLAAGLVIVEEGNDFKGTRPADMPAVAPQELALVRRHLGELLTIGGPPQPIRSE